jgi:hypothetical protein
MHSSDLSSSPDSTEEQKLIVIANRNGFTVEAARAILDGMRRSGGTMSQFDHPDVGGMGQWSSGMLMIGDMFNSALKSRVEKLCNELADLARQSCRNSGAETIASSVATSDRAAASQWWPESFGAPSTAGSQNQSRYAYFPASNRLAIERDGQVTIYDTGLHKIYAVSQSQGLANELEFESQLGRVALSSLQKV